MGLYNKDRQWLLVVKNEKMYYKVVSNSYIVPVIFVTQKYDHVNNEIQYSTTSSYNKYFDNEVDAVNYAFKLVVNCKYIVKVDKVTADRIYDFNFSESL